MNADDLKKGVGGYVFISHSHKDFEKVRLIRNAMEEQGFEPICFFLKCLSDDDEIEDLIKREIDARELFVYVDSANARASTWVQREREHIERRGRKVSRVVDLESGVPLEKEMRHLLESMRVYICYPHKAGPATAKIKDALIARDLRVFRYEDEASPSWSERDFKRQLDEAIDNGCVLFLIAEGTAESNWQELEVRYALEKGACILPVLVGDAAVPEKLRLPLATLSTVRISRDPTQEELAALADGVEALLTERFEKG